MPIDISNLGKGAIKDTTDKRDYKFTANFTAVQLPETFSLRDKIQVVKNQGGSGSCGGQAFSYHMEINTLLRDKTPTALSAKSIYQPVYIPPEGSQARDLANRIDTVGVCLESDVPSYDNGQPPSEAFMEDGSSITKEAIAKAIKYSGRTYLTFSSQDLEQVKQAIYQGNSAVIAVLGNNACWTTDNGEIEVPVAGATTWGHFVCLIGWQTRNGKLYFEFVNSWGDGWGDKGFGYLPADYLVAGFGYNEWIIVERPIPEPVNHIFNVDINYGDNSEEVKFLQQKLIFLGYNTLVTGYYGELTRKAVKQLQWDYHVANPIVLLWNNGKHVYSSTRKALNKA